MSNAPDRIWVDYSPHTESYGHISDADDGGYSQYLLSNPARQHAETLLEALRKIADHYNDTALAGHHMQGIARAALAKIDNAS